MSATDWVQPAPSPSRAQARQWARTMWAAARPLLVLISAAFAGLGLAVALYSLMTPILAWLADMLTWIAQGLGLSEPSPETRSRSNIPIGVGAFGVVILLTTLQETRESVTNVLLNWTQAGRAVLVPAFSSVLVGFTALGLSVYGIADLASAPQRAPATIAFDSAFIPPAVANADTGEITFFVSFLEEGGLPSLTDEDHASVTLRPSDKEFLQQLGAGLRKCSDESSGRIPLLYVRGFASSSTWNLTATEFDKWVLARPADDLVRHAHAEIAGYAQEDPVHADRDRAMARAFNVYLANRRRDQVIGALGIESNRIRLSSDGRWSNYADMDGAISIEDRGVENHPAAAGILTRSVAVTIVDAAACTRMPKFARVELTKPSD